MSILTVKAPSAIAIISRGTTLVLVVVAGHDVCCKIFGIWNNRLPINPFWKIICILLGWVPTRVVYLWPAVFVDMALLATLATSHVWLDRRPSSISTTISTVVALQVNLLQRIVDQPPNGHSVCLWKWMLFLIILLACSRFPPIFLDKIAVFTRRLLC